MQGVAWCIPLLWLRQSCYEPARGDIPLSWIAPRKTALSSGQQNMWLLILSHRVSTPMASIQLSGGMAFGGPIKQGVDRLESTVWLRLECILDAVLIESHADAASGGVYKDALRQCSHT